MKPQNRKRKITNMQSQRKPMLPVLRALGITVNHPVLIQDTEMPNKKKGDNQDVMKMLCFAGIPACCLSSRGSGPNESIAAESAAHAMVDFFRTVMPEKQMSSFLANPQTSSLDAFVSIFKEFDKVVSDDYLSINRCTQYDMTPGATIRGKEAKRRVINVLKKSKNGANPKAPKNLTPDETSVIILGNDDEVTVQVPNDSSNPIEDDEVVILNDEGPSSKEEIQAVKEMREEDAEKKSQAEEQRTKRITRRGVHVDFGKMNTSNSGPSPAFSASPNATSNQYAAANYSSDSDDEVVAKRPKLANPSGDVVVHTTSANENSGGVSAVTVSDSDDEIGEIIDEWNENDESKESDGEVQANASVPESQSKKTDENGRDERPVQFEEMLFSKGVPQNYQTKTIGVVVNDKLVHSVSAFVARATKNAMESMKKLASLTWDHYKNNTQTEAIYDKKMRARQLLYNEIQKLFPDKMVSLQVTGSTINGCGSYNSDVDMCLCCPTNGYRGHTFDDFQCDRSYSFRALKKVEKTLKRLSHHHPLRRYIRQCELIPAKVPIIKLQLSGEFAGVEIDINVNHIAGIYNSHLIHYYSLADVRFPALALMVKHWAMKAGVNNSPDGYLNSYSVILLVIHFLQCGVRPAVLPNLQYLYPDKFDRKLPLDELLLFGDIVSILPVPATPPNTTSLGELLVGFFHYYSQFDFDRDGISIRSAQVVPRKTLPRWAQDTPMFVEEPFDAINTARSVRLASHMNAIKSAFRSAAAVFTKDTFGPTDFGVSVVSR